MKILTCDQIRKVDQYTIENEPITSVDLMERAAKSCFIWFTEHFGRLRRVKIFVGPGDNGGDGLAIARMLANDGNEVSVYMLSPSEKLSPDAFENYNRLMLQGIVEVFQLDGKNFPVITEHEIVIDALFGSGLSRPLDGLAAKVVQLINQGLATVVSIDIPSGLYGEDNTLNKTGTIVEADYTLTFQMPKLSFFFAENDFFVGNLAILDIKLMPEAMQCVDSAYILSETSQMKRLLKVRRRFSHKGTYGHALLISGAYGKVGAAVLASKACLRTGVGLFTLHTPRIGYNIIQTAIPEAMLSVDDNDFNISKIPETGNYTAIGIGPGIGTSNETSAALYEIISNAKVPIVLDADALNILSIHPDWIQKLPQNSILTPHPREFDRLAGASTTGYERHLKQIDFSKVNHVIVVLKGAYTSITSPEGMCYFNSTGNPGMATAGSGDVLTGIILSLLSQGYKPMDAACLGVYIHGSAGDLGSYELSEEALIASDIIKYLGSAFKKLKNKQ